MCIQDRNYYLKNENRHKIKKRQINWIGRRKELNEMEGKEHLADKEKIASLPPPFSRTLDLPLVEFELLQNVIINGNL